MIVYSDTHKIKNIGKYTNHKTECLHVTACDTVNTLLLWVQNLGTKQNKQQQLDKTHWHVSLLQNWSNHEQWTSFLHVASSKERTQIPPTTLPPVSNYTLSLILSTGPVYGILSLIVTHPKNPTLSKECLQPPDTMGSKQQYTCKSEYLMAWAAHKFPTKTYLETKEPCNLRVGHWTLITRILIWYLVLFFCSTNNKTPGMWAITGTTLSCQPTFSWSHSTAKTTKHIWRHHKSTNKPHLDYSSFICCSKYPTFLCCSQISRNYLTTTTDCYTWIWLKVALNSWHIAQPTSVEHSCSKFSM